MAKYYGKIGYSLTVDVGEGVFEPIVEEHVAYGDVLANSRLYERGEKVNEDLNINNRISIVRNAYSSENFHAIRYAWWMGTRWKVTDITVEGPRLIMRLGGVYEGPTP